MFYSMCYADEYYHNQLCIVEFKVTAHMESSRNKGLGQYRAYRSAWGPITWINSMYFIKREMILF